MVDVVACDVSELTCVFASCSFVSLSLETGFPSFGLIGINLNAPPENSMKTFEFNKRIDRPQKSYAYLDSVETVKFPMDFSDY